VSSAASSFPRRRESRVIRVSAGALLVLLCASFSAFAQFDEALPDPTVPLDYIAFDSAGTNSAESQFALGQGLRGLFTSYQLDSVLIRAGDRIAVINGERVREGDRIGNATVATIESGRVMLNVDGELEALELYDNSIKTLVRGDE
jgi:hypothetical protein